MVAANALVCGNEFPVLKPRWAHAPALGRFLDAHPFGSDSDVGMANTVSDTGVQSMMMVTGGKRDG